MQIHFCDLIVCELCYNPSMDKSPTVYVTIRLPVRAAAKLDWLGEWWLCRSRSETMRRLIADAPGGFAASTSADSDREAAA
jgi:hypothetical protein